MKNLSLILDNSKKISILNRQNDIYKFFGYIHINNFEVNMTDILKDFMIILSLFLLIYIFNVSLR